VKNEEFLTVSSEDAKVNVQIIAGELNGTNGRIGTQTAVNAYMIDVQNEGSFNLNVPKSHQSLVYLLNGKVTINGAIVLETNEDQLIWFEQDGEGFSIQGNANSKLLFLSGEPIDEKTTSWGPYVMNSQTEITKTVKWDFFRTDKYAPFWGVFSI
jgi:hypothetical protein